MLADCTAHSAAEPRWMLLYDLPLLLSSAAAQPLAALTPYGCGTPLAGAALPVLRQCGLITVYRCTHQCGERSNAAFGRQSAAGQTSLAPHDSKARLISVTTCRRFMAKPCTLHPHCAARAVIQAANPQWRVKGRRPLRSLGGPRGPFSHVREWPPFPYPPRVWGKCSTTYKWSISAHSTVYISSRCRRGRDRCGRSSGPCGAAFSPCRRRRWRRRCRRPRARA